MAAVTTARLMQIALEMAGETTMPPDCAIYYNATRIGHVFIGLDAGSADLFMARQLGYHAVITHTRAGATGPFWEVYRRHVSQMTAAGVSQEIAEAAVAARIEELRLDALAENDDHAPSVARLLEMPFLCIGSPLAELGRRALQARVDATLATQPGATVADVHAGLRTLPEFAAASTEMRLALGAEDAPAGRVVVSHAAYAPPDYAIARAYLTSGVETLCCASFAYADAQRLAAEGIPGTILVMGRCATESVGIRPYIARLRADGLEVTTFAGLLSDD